MKTVMMIEENKIQRKIKELEEASVKAKEELEDELLETRGIAEHYLKYALLAGGGLFTSFLLIRKLFSSSKSSDSDSDSSRKQDHKISSSIASNLKNRFLREVTHQVTLFLLDLAKEKIIEYLKEKNDEGRRNDSQVID